MLEELGFFFLNYNGMGLVCNKYLWNKCMFLFFFINFKVRECINSLIKYKIFDVEYLLRFFNIKFCVGLNFIMLLFEIVNLLKFV